jgi:PadR family transcriptional regulator, regulatory protein AphA
MRTIGYALLALLAREPLSGYDIARQLRERVGNFWYASHSHVYPELARLEADGLVVHELVEQSDRPDKKVFAITGPGRDLLRQWATAPAAEMPTRDELVLKTYAIWLVDRSAALALYREHERRHLAQLERYERARGWMEQEWRADLRRPDSPHFASYAALRRGIGYEREYAAWCGWMVEQLAQEGPAG